MRSSWRLALNLSATLALTPIILSHGQSASEQSQTGPAETTREKTHPPNRLKDESSPYLLLHANNPVDWYPWGDEAIQRARELDRPIFLSVGYSTCYWCHVMEEECFESETIAELLNDSFVSIKVDREERPDLDEIYMTATQLIRRSGGWPNSVFLTPELKPFFAGTYFPEEQFANVLTRLNETWKNNRGDVERSANQIAEAMQRIAMTQSAEPGALNLPTRALVDASINGLVETFDGEWGGFGSAPKFPSPSNLFLLWSRAERDPRARQMVLDTLSGMARGAIYDHLDGGFHRYTVDGEWRVPHFEKMLYDNALLSDLLVTVLSDQGADANAELARVARGTLDFVLETLTLESGGFKSAIDAQTDGLEGAFYIWKDEELREVLTQEEREFVNPIFALGGAPNFEEHYYTLYLTDSLDTHAERLGVSRQVLLERLLPILDKLNRRRATRQFPLVDDKVLTDWNGMMIRALARASLHFKEPEYQKAAERSARFILEQVRSPRGILQHSFREGARVDAFLDDYAFFIRGLIALHESTGEPDWLKEAERLAQELEARLAAPDGGYYLSAKRDYLLFQPKNVYDNAIPSANATMALAYLELEQATGNSEYRRYSENTLRAFSGDFEAYPSAARTLALAAETYLSRHGQKAMPQPISEASSSAPSPTGERSGSPMEALALSVLDATLRVEEQRSGDGWRDFELRVELDDGWHVNANPASFDYLIPTELRGELEAVSYPPGSRFRFAFAEEELSVYGGLTTFKGRVRDGSTGITLRYQACDDTRCLAPVEKVLEILP